MKIKELRCAAGLTQMQLAEKLGVSRATIAMWETGQNWPSAQMLPALAEALQCTIGDLYATESESDAV
jgi:DNA-binding XRE family transcriptional regulator